MTKAIAVSLLGLVLAACTLSVTQTQPVESISPSPSPSPAQALPQATEAGKVVQTKTFSLAEIAEHNVEADCWLIVDGRVYDLTGFIASSEDLGSDEILEGCGKDATELFVEMPRGMTRDLLAEVMIGTLAQ